MALLNPLTALLAQAQHIGQIAAPPYDVVSSHQARQFAKHKPFNMLHLTRPEIDLPQSCATPDASIYQLAKNNYLQFLENGAFNPLPKQGFAIYKISSPSHSQTGLFALVDTSSAKLKKHEQTKPNKVEDREQLTRTLKAQISPVMLTHAPNRPLRDLLASHSQNQEPMFDLEWHDGYRHQFWWLENEKTIPSLNDALQHIDSLYIADGHHRCQTSHNLSLNWPAEFDPMVLAAIFPSNELKVEGYHRILKDTNGHNFEKLRQLIQDHYSISPHPEPYLPQQNMSLGWYINKQWYALDAKFRLDSPTTVEQLDVYQLHHRLIEPIFGIDCPKTSSRIDFVGGIEAISEIEQRVDHDEMACAFTLAPTKIEEVIAVSNANANMPPKSTWFEPKLLDGFLINPY